MIIKVLAIWRRCLYTLPTRGRNVAQPGRALAWGARGRGFESRHSDQLSPLARYLITLCAFRRNLVRAAGALWPVHKVIGLVLVRVNKSMETAGKSMP